MKRPKVVRMTRKLGAVFIAVLTALGMLMTVSTASLAAASAPGLPGRDTAASANVSAADRAAVAAKRNGSVRAQAGGPITITLSFDDGRATQYNASQILDRYGFKGTFYIISKGLDDGIGYTSLPIHLTTAQLHKMENNGHEVGGHTRDHPDLTGLSTAAQTTEICGGRQDLIDAGFSAPVSFAYPYGSFNVSAEKVAASCGFTNARSTLPGGPDTLPPGTPMATIPLIAVDAAYPPADMERTVTAAEANGSGTWAQVYWHDVTTATNPGWGADATEAQFTEFISWLSGEVAAGRVVVKTAGEAMDTPAPYGSIGGLWNAKGGYSSFLGTPLNNEYDVSGVAGARMEDFAGGKIYWSPSTGAHEVHGAILGKYLEWGGPAGYGLPATDEAGTPDGVGRFNHFDGGRSIYWTPNTDAHTVYGSIRGEWQMEGWETGVMGYPTTDESDATGGRYNGFQGGAIVWSPASGAHETHGAIRALWAAQDFERGPLGFPTSNEFDIPGGRRSNFQGGYITWTPGGGPVIH